MTTYKIFNFNVYPCFSLSTHSNCIEKLHHETHVTYGNTDHKVAFKHFDYLSQGGLILYMQTIPSTVYHLFLTGQVVNGDKVNIRVVNPQPNINLSPEISIKIGDQDSRSICFRALSSKTNLIISTPRSCLDFAPYSFILHSLEIIPDCLICKGIIEGPTGPIGIQGDIGVQLPPGPTGLIGITGIQGSTGFTGYTGSDGPLGLIGPFGPFGPAAAPSTLIGNTGPQGFDGLMGAIGSIGPIGLDGPQGITGSSGDAGPLGNLGSVGPAGDLGLQGATGFQGNNGVLVNTTSGTFTGTWSRSNESPGAATFNWERVGDRVTLNMGGFSSIPTGGEIFNAPLFLVPDTGDFLIPPEIRPTFGTQSFYTIPYLFNGTPQEGVLQLGPATLIFYRSTTLASFTPTDSVVFPESTKTYLIV